MEESLDNWFKREVLAHEEALQRYLLRTWPRREEIGDLRQETYARVYEAASVSRPQSARAFLFATARHLLTDRLRRERVVSIEAVGDIDELNVLIDEVSPERRIGARQELRRLAQAFDQLPPRCREVVWLGRVEGLSTKEIAERLRISVRTAENQVFRGMKALGASLFGREDSGRPPGGSGHSESEDRHG